MLRQKKKPPERGPLPAGRRAVGPDEPQDGSVGPRRTGLSLRARALNLLAMREHSRVELVRKLSQHAESEEQLGAVLDELERAGHLSQQRFVESLIRRRAARYGSRLIEHELQGHRVDDEISAPLLRELASDERQRALDVWRKRFGRPPADLAERARQHRFLAQRGFDAEVISSVFRTIRQEPRHDD